MKKNGLLKNIKNFVLSFLFLALIALLYACDTEPDPETNPGEEGDHYAMNHVIDHYTINHVTIEKSIVIV